MLISGIYDPSPMPGFSAQENIMSNNVKDLYDEILQMIFETKVTISPLKTIKKGKDTTGAIKLAENLNKAFEIALGSAGWEKSKAPGGNAQNLIDFYKSKPSGRAYGVKELGIGLEIQFGNNYQFNEDIKRLTEAYLAGSIVAGVSIVSSDLLSTHKADRGASFSDAKSKLDRHLETLVVAQAKRFPPIVILGVQHDSYNDDQFGLFEIQAVKLTRDDRNLLQIIPDIVLSNKDNRVIQKRHEANQIIEGDSREEDDSPSTD